jgi:hypothetical protein
MGIRLHDDVELVWGDNYKFGAYLTPSLKMHMNVSGWVKFFNFKLKEVLV